MTEQRAHVKSDFHAFNLKRRTRGEPSVDEPEFERLIEQLTESISGSDSDSSSDEDPSNLSSLLRKKATLNNTLSYDDDPNRKARNRGPGQAPLVWFSTPALPENTSLGIYRTLFPSSSTPDSYLNTLKSIQIRPNQEDRHIAMFMLGGGHFAGMIVSLIPKPGSERGEKVASVLAHKTFHRYTTRRKQGGAQSANDASKGNAHSAGAGIRRHNEAALMAEVRGVLGEWRELIQSADLVFLRATGRENRRIVFGYEEAVLGSRDPRIRGFPFNTRRATQSELMRCFVELTRVKISTLTSEALAALNTPPSSTSSLAPSKPTTKPKPAAKPKLSEEEETAQHHTSQLLPLIRRQKLPALISYLSNNSLSATDFRLYPPAQHRHAPTLLHFAAANNLALAVSTLLQKCSVNPTAKNDDGKTPYEVAGDRDTRDAFRIARYELGENKWAWEDAKVGSAVSRKDVDERKKKEEQEGKAERMKDLEQAKKELKEREEEERRKRVGEGRTMGSGGGRGGGVELVTGMGQEGLLRGLSEEAKRRLERERRARAAEERIRRMAGGN